MLNTPVPDLARTAKQARDRSMIEPHVHRHLYPTLAAHGCTGAHVLEGGAAVVHRHRYISVWAAIYI